MWSRNGLRRRLGSVVEAVDAFRQPKQEALQQVTWIGVWLTASAVAICAALLILQLQAFLSNEASSSLELDTDQSELLRLNFNVTISDLPCDFATVGIFDAFGNAMSNVTRGITKQPLDHVGAEKGHPFAEEELTELEFGDRPQLSQEELAQLDADWISEVGHLEAGGFHAALEAHNFVFVLFCVVNVGPCKMILPAWLQFADQVNKREVQLTDADGAVADVWALQVNCAAFSELCQEEGVRAFPQVRFYPRTVQKKAVHKDVEFAFPAPLIMMSMMANVRLGDDMLAQMRNALLETAKGVVKQRHLHTNASHHAMFREGCRLSGHLDVPRVPGTIHFEARSAADRTLNAAFTNLSHTVHDLSFGRPDAEPKNRRKLLDLLPEAYGLHADPMQARGFHSHHFHQGAHHYVRVMHTRLEASEHVRVYLYMHQWYMQTYPRHESPKAKISYDISPLEVVVEHRRRWYDFATSTLALVGGAYSSVEIAYRILGLLSSVTSPSKLTRKGVS